MMNYVRIADGKPVTEDEAFKGGILRDGYKVVTGFYMRDQAQLTDNGQADYEQRIANAWQDGAADDAKQVPPPVTKDSGQAAYERRLVDAWKGE